MNERVFGAVNKKETTLVFVKSKKIKKNYGSFSAKGDFRTRFP